MRLTLKLLWLALALKPELVLYLPLVTEFIGSRLKAVSQVVQLAWQGLLGLLQSLQLCFL